MLAPRTLATAALAGFASLALASAASAVPVFSQTFPAGGGTQEFTLDFFTTAAPGNTFNPTIAESGGVVRAQVQNLRPEFFSVGGQAVVPIAGLATATTLSDITFQADVGLGRFGGGGGTDFPNDFTFVIESRNAGGMTTGTLTRVFTLATPTNDLRTVGGTLDTFTASNGSFDLNAPNFRLNLRSDARGIGGFFTSDGANAGISFDNVLIDVTPSAPIPEPATAGVILAAVGGLAMRRRRN